MPQCDVCERVLCWFCVWLKKLMNDYDTSMAVMR